MNRITTLLLFGILSSLTSANAQGNGPVEITFSTQNSLQFTTTDRLVIKNNEIIFNSEKIDPLEIPLALPSLRVLANVKPHQELNCPSGTYQHTIKRNGKLEHTVGCLNSARATQLLDSIHTLSSLVFE